MCPVLALDLLLNLARLLLQLAEIRIYQSDKFYPISELLQKTNNQPMKEYNLPIRRSIRKYILCVLQISHIVVIKKTEKIWEYELVSCLARAYGIKAVGLILQI